MRVGLYSLAVSGTLCELATQSIEPPHLRRLLTPVRSHLWWTVKVSSDRVIAVLEHELWCRSLKGCQCA